MTDSFLGRYIGIFIAVIVGIVLIVALSDQIWETTNTFTQDSDNQSISSIKQANGNMTEGGQITLSSTFIRSLSSVVLDNITQSVTLTEGTDFTLDKTTGVVTFKDTETLQNEGGNNTEWAYTHGENFIEDTVSRTFLNLIIIFFALGILFVALQFGDEIKRIFN